MLPSFPGFYNENGPTVWHFTVSLDELRILLCRADRDVRVAGGWLAAARSPLGGRAACPHTVSSALGGGQGVAVASELESLRVNSSVLQRPVPLWAAGSSSGPAGGWSLGGGGTESPARPRRVSVPGSQQLQNSLSCPSFPCLLCF